MSSYNKFLCGTTCSLLYVECYLPVHWVRKLNSLTCRLHETTQKQESLPIARDKELTPAVSVPCTDWFTFYEDVMLPFLSSL